MLHAATLITDKKQTQHQIILFKLHSLHIILFVQKKLSSSFNGSCIFLGRFQLGKDMAQPLGDEEELQVEENEGTREAQAERGEGKGREMRRWRKREVSTRRLRG